MPPAGAVLAAVAGGLAFLKIKGAKKARLSGRAVSIRIKSEPVRASLRNSFQPIAPLPSVQKDTKEPVARSNCTCVADDLSTSEMRKPPPTGRPTHNSISPLNPARGTSLFPSGTERHCYGSRRERMKIGWAQGGKGVGNQFRRCSEPNSCNLTCPIE